MGSTGTESAFVRSLVPTDPRTPRGGACGTRYQGDPLVAEAEEVVGCAPARVEVFDADDVDVVEFRDGAVDEHHVDPEVPQALPFLHVSARWRCDDATH
jgi:hypothetical protein